MGGGALGRQMPRLDREVYVALSRELCTILAPYWQVVRPPRVFADKQSFGDIDVMVAGEKKTFDAAQDLGAETVHRNGNVTSFEFRGYQVDLISVNVDKLELACFFCDFGDFGGIFGSMCCRLGLKAGPKGLYYRGDATILLTDDLHAICDFMGLDIEIWRRGFSLPADSFDFLRTSPFFSRSLFGKLDGKARTRQRPLVQQFLEFLKLETAGASEGVTGVGAHALHHFGKEAVLQAVYADKVRREAIGARLNGRLVMQWTGLTGKQLGGFLSECRREIGDDELLGMKPEDVRARVRTLFGESADSQRAMLAQVMAVLRCTARTARFRRELRHHVYGC